MKLSILVANYNNGNYFKDCYESIINQTYQNFEVIILDDCSTDDSVGIIKSLIKNDERFKLYFNEKNGGVGFTKNRLIELATGEICGFVDPDDTITKEAVEVMIKIHTKYPKAAGVYSLAQYCDSELNPTHVEKRKYHGIASNNKYFFNFDHRVWHFFTFKLKIYRTTEGINPKYMIAEDQDLYLKLYEKGSLKFVNKILYNYRLHKKGVSQSNKERTRSDYSLVLFDAIRRRGIEEINGEKITEKTDLFKLLEYQDKIPYKLKEIFRMIFFG